MLAPSSVRAGYRIRLASVRGPTQRGAHLRCPLRGQNRKSSTRAHAFRFAPESRHYATHSDVRFVRQPNPDTTRYGYHHLTGQKSLLLAPRATRLCQANAKSVSNTAPMPTGANRNDHDILVDTTTSGAKPARGCNVPVRCIAIIGRPTANAASQPS